MGGQVFVNIKSGTNPLHGTLFEFLRNSRPRRHEFLREPQRLPEAGIQAESVRRDRGRAHQKDKTSSSAPSKARARAWATASRPPSRCSRCATATSTASARCSIRRPPKARPPASPASRSPGNIIPKNRWDPLFPKLLALYPLPTDNSRITDNYFFSPTETNDVDTIDVKGDHNLNDRSRISAALRPPQPRSLRAGSAAAAGRWRPGDHHVNPQQQLRIHAYHHLRPVADKRVPFRCDRHPHEVRHPVRRAAVRSVRHQRDPEDQPRHHRTTTGYSRFTPAGYVEIGSRSFWPNTNNVRNYQFTDTLFKNCRQAQYTVWRRNPAGRRVPQRGTLCARAVRV